MKKILLLILVTALPLIVEAQITFNGNTNSGFGNPVGSSTLAVSHTGTAVNFTFTKGSGNFNDMLVIYISNGSEGRASINNDFADSSDDFRRAVCIAGNGQANFPSGFHATHAIAIRQGTANQASPLFSIPATGNVGSGALPFIKHVGNPTSNTQTFFTFSFNWSDIGLTSSDQLSFVAVYGNPNDSGNMFLSNEGYGGGFPSSNIGTGTLNVDTYFQYPSGFKGGNSSTLADGLWSANSTWVNGNPPLAGNAVTISHNVTLNTNATVGTLTINTSKIFVASDETPRILSFSNGGTLTNSGTFTPVNGTVAFAGSGSVTGTVNFNNVIIAGGVNFGTASTIGSGGFLQINGGGFIDSNAPFYKNNSTLVYNINGNYGRGLEWSATSGKGYPGNVQIGNTSNNTIFDLSVGGTNVARQCAGNLTVNSGSTLTLNNMSQALTIKGKYTNSGTTILSSAGGGDLKLEGDMDDNGTFTANTRAIFFEGANIQTINSTANPLDIDVMRIGKTGGEVILAQNLLVDETNDPIQLTTAASILNLNDKNATFGKASAASMITMNALSSIKGSASSSLTVLGTGNFGTIYFDQSTPGTTNVIGNLTVNRTGSGAVTFGNTVVVNSELIIGNQTTINNGILDLKGVLTDNRSTKTYNGTIHYSGADQNILAGTYNNLSLINSGSKTFGGDTTISGNFLITDATVIAPTTMTFNGPAAQNIAGLSYKNIAFAGVGSKTFTSNASVSSTNSISFTGSGSVDFDGAGDDLNFTLKSDVTGTASVGDATNWTLNGKVIAERYIPASRSWRILTAPLTGVTDNTITDNWQGTDNEGILLFSPDTFQSQTMVGYETGGSSPNIRKYDGGWQYITNLTTENMFGATTTETKPFLVFATGPSNSLNIVTGATATTLRPKGQLITGTVNHSGLAINTFHAMANPYASAINPASLLANNTDQKLWLIDPTLGNFGAYVTFDGTDWAPTEPTGADAFIQSGQGFFVRSSSTTSFSISEGDKVSGSSNNWFAKNATTSTTTNADKIRVLLYKQIENIWKLADGTLSVNYADGSNEVNAMDSNKISNFNESIMFRNNATNLSIEHRALPLATDMQPIRLTGTTALPYQLRVKTENYSNSTLLPVLEDTLSGTFTAIPTDGSEVIIPFTGAVATATNPDNRFRLVYQVNLNTVENSPLVASVFPNPVTNNQLHIHLGNSELANYTITNLLGQAIQNGSLNDTQNVITFSAVNQGFYILNITQEGKSFTTKIYVQ